MTKHEPPERRRGVFRLPACGVNGQKRGFAIPSPYKMKYPAPARTAADIRIFAGLEIALDLMDRDI